MKIELLYFDGCPGHDALLPRLRELLEEAGLDGPVEQRCIESQQAAEHERFLGSPTLRVDGRDVEPGAESRQDYGVKCRLYGTNRGLRGVPSDGWIRDALRRAT